MNTPANRRILIADDHAAIHGDFRKILTPEKARGPLSGGAVVANDAEAFEIESAMQGRDALEKVKRAVQDGRPFAVAFVDVRMPPGWDGIETIVHLWQADPALHVALCTAYSDYSREKIIAQLGENDRLVILKKPFDSIEVLQLARTLTGKWNTIREVQRHVAELDRRVAQRTQHLREANEELRRSEERLTHAFNSISTSGRERPEAPPAGEAPRGGYTILVAEDDALVRSHVKNLLTHHEYRVLEAANASAAIEVWRDQRGSIDLLLTDMVMPGSGNGLDLARRFLRESPNLKVIYTSGYSVARFANDVTLQEGRNYLPKPYFSNQLIDVLRNALEPETAG